MNQKDKKISVDIFRDLERRGLVADATAGLKDMLWEGNPLTLYFGVDPTNDSLHLGHFLGVIMLERFRIAGYRPLVLVGGATGMVGDPSGRSKERNFLDDKTLEHNFSAIKAQMQQLAEIPDEDFFDNRQWTNKMGILDFLRDVGKHVPISQMLAKESVKARMESEDGISFTEFSYMLIQAYDFLELYESHQCVLQVGGSDQWGNITAGVDLIRRSAGGQAHGLTWPLIEKEDGQKFGKAAEGTVWLDKTKTSPYDLYQYLLNLDDESACRLLYWLTLPLCDDLDEVVAEHKEAPDARNAQKRLATWVVGYVHGAEAAKEAEEASSVVFSYSGGSLSSDYIKSIRGLIPETTITHAELETEEALVELLVKTELCESKSDARRQAQQGAIYINHARVLDNARFRLFLKLDGRQEPIKAGYLLLGRGKKKRHLLVLEK